MSYGWRVVATLFGALGVTMAVFLAQAVGLGLVALAPSLPGGLFLMIVVLGAANGMGTLACATTLAEVCPVFWTLAGARVVVGTVVAVAGREARVPAAAPGA